MSQGVTTSIAQTGTEKTVEFLTGDLKAGKVSTCSCIGFVLVQLICVAVNPMFSFCLILFHGGLHPLRDFVLRHFDGACQMLNIQRKTVVFMCKRQFTQVSFSLQVIILSVSRVGGKNLILVVNNGCLLQS